MNDVSTEKPLCVSTVGGVGPFMMLPLSQLEEVTQLFEDQGIRYWVEEDAISLDGGPEIVVINFGRHGDAEAVQRVLDECPLMERREAACWRGQVSGATILSNASSGDQAMNDVSTEKPLCVSTVGDVGPFMMLPLSQLEEVTQLFEDQGIRHWVEENAISMNGGPEIVVINFGRHGDAEAVQRALDSVR